MSDNEQKNETVDYVLAEMLECADAIQTHGTTHGVRLAIREFVNRIKAAWKRERAKVEADALAVGGIVEAARHKPVSNAAAMREALLNIQEYAAAMDVDDGNVLAILDACRDALAAPPRQCDVGTAEEQEERLVEFCNSTDCGRCPHNRVGMDFRGCTLAWAQMPYEAQEGGKE